MFNFILFSIYAAKRKSKTNLSQRNSKTKNQEPSRAGVLNKGYEQGSLGNLHIDGEGSKQMYLTKNKKGLNAKGTNNNVRGTPRGTDIFLSNFETSTFGAKNIPETTDRGNVIINVDDDFDHKKDRNNGLGSYLHKFEKSEIARKIFKNSIRRFKETSKKIRNFEII